VITGCVSSSDRAEQTSRQRLVQVADSRSLMQKCYCCRVIPIVRLWDGFDHNFRADGQSAKLVGVIRSGVGLPRCAAVEIQRVWRTLVNCLLADWAFFFASAKPPHAEEPYAEVR
jgi:hypothetical protein